MIYFLGVSFGDQKEDLTKMLFLNEMKRLHNTNNIFKWKTTHKKCYKI